MNNFKYADIKIGLIEKFSVIISEDIVNSFSRISGDENPLHIDENYAKSKNFKGKVVFGMLVASYLSRLAGMHLPGLNSLILSVNTNFIKPVYVNDKLEIIGEVTDKKDFGNIIKINVIITNQKGIIVTKGDMLVKVME